ncbi:Translational regulator CsrA [Austwickia sp. TVS 96-490-7B]|uniref:carbon storage regulator CsrA n=1 Tax=Austwickia sp. TVS 96-490-7B TaxID=2830843 RepID=UPI001C56ACB7|nr:carbon storage regulator CsrA [Austwickia sp. TVS 96-490-7B]MBW3085451.1 Translational regulator CsrA [Austwickia sp. TVS 96-490-7B]
MLVLSRRPQQSLLIGNDVVVTVLEVNGDTVRIGITAPPEVDIHREEVYLDLKKSNAESAAAPGSAAALSRRMRGRDRNAGSEAAGQDSDAAEPGGHRSGPVPTPPPRPCAPTPTPAQPVPGPVR